MIIPVYIHVQYNTTHAVTVHVLCVQLVHTHTSTYSTYTYYTCTYTYFTYTYTIHVVHTQSVCFTLFHLQG